MVPLRVTLREPSRRDRARLPAPQIGIEKGYATEASRALTRRGLTELGAQRVVAQTMAVNLTSRRVLGKAGLTLVRIFHQPWPYPVDGRELGDAEYALSKAEWERQD